MPLGVIVSVNVYVCPVTDRRPVQGVPSGQLQWSIQYIFIPAPKITKNGEGSALLKNPELIGEIVYAVSKALTKPLTVKIRKGFDDDSVSLE